MIGIINFTHSDPLYNSLGKKEGIIRESPGKILKMVLEGSLEGGMVSLVSLLENRLELVKGANIHSISNTMSTLLVSKGKELSKSMDIAVTSHTRTTELYLEMALKGLGISYRLIHTEFTEAEDLLTIADYALVIGDEALKVYGSTPRILLDTGFEFSRQYHLQPLYAVMCHRPGEGEPSGIEYVNSAVFPSHATKEKAAESASERLGISLSVMRRYYSVIRYDYQGVLNDTVDFVSRHLIHKLE